MKTLVVGAMLAASFSPAFADTVPPENAGDYTPVNSPICHQCGFNGTTQVTIPCASATRCRSSST